MNADALPTLLAAALYLWQAVTLARRGDLPLAAVFLSYTAANVALAASISFPRK